MKFYGAAFGEYFEGFHFGIMRCDEKTKHRLPAGKVCKSEEEINEKMNLV